MTPERKAELLEEAFRQFRRRVFLAECRPGASDHSTSCIIWGDDGQGNTEEGFQQPLPCNCGALRNFERSKREAAEVEIARLSAHYAKSELRVCDLTDELIRTRANVEVALDGRDETIRRLQAEVQTARQSAARECLKVCDGYRFARNVALAIRTHFGLEGK